MIYATAAVGQEFCEKYSKIISKEGTLNSIYVLTDYPELFSNCKVTLYNRKVWSYVEKIIFLLKVVLEVKQRVTFIDADVCNRLNPKLKLDDEKVYVHDFINLSESHNILHPLNKAVDIVAEVLGEFNLSHSQFYLFERSMSIPYTYHTEEILTLLQKIQPKWESVFNQKNVINVFLERYTKYGVGYCEGAALNGVLNKFNVQFKRMNLNLLYKKSIF